MDLFPEFPEFIICFSWALWRWKFQLEASNIGTCNVGTSKVEGRLESRVLFDLVLSKLPNCQQPGPSIGLQSLESIPIISTAHVSQTPSLSCEELHNRPLCLCCSRSTWQANWRCEGSSCKVYTAFLASLDKLSDWLFAHLLQSISGRWFTSWNALRFGTFECRWVFRTQYTFTFSSIESVLLSGRRVRWLSVLEGTTGYQSVQLGTTATDTGKSGAHGLRF